jgi:hypothetical protein
MALGITGPFETWKEGIPYACLRGDIEKVAGLTVHEPDDGVVHFARWRPFNQVAVSRSAVPSPAREEDAAARDGAGDTNASPRSDRESIPVKPDDPFTARMFEALNAMMLDMLAAIARKDYDDRRRRQMQGIAKAKPTANIVAGPRIKKRNIAIMNMLRRRMSWNSIIEAASSFGKKLSRATLSKLARRVREAA